MTAATPILYYTPQPGSTWTNMGSAGSAYNATCSTPNKYAVGSNGHPYWSCYQDYICIPSGAAIDSTRYASFEIGIYYETKDSGQQFQKLWDKAWGAFDIYIDTTWDCLTVMRATATGGHNYYWTTDAGDHTRQFVAGHYYYIQISWDEGTSPANFGGVSLRVGVDGSAPVAWSLTEDSQSPTSAWMSHAGSSANLCNTSSAGSCPASANVAWQHGRLYVFRQYNTLVNFNTEGHWDVDKYLWLTGLPNSTIKYDSNAFSAASGNSITSDGSQTTVATAYNSSKTADGSTTVWSLPGGSSYISIPATTNYASEPNLAFDIDVYIPTQTGSNKALLQRIADNGYQTSIYLDTTYNRLLVTRGTTTPDQESWTTPINSITYNKWWNIQVVWNITAGESETPVTPPPGGHPDYLAGWRASNCIDGYQYQQPPSYWVNVATAIASDFDGYSPGGIWIIGLIQDDNQTCKLQFDGTSDDPYISFTTGTDVNEAYLDAFDAAGVYIWLQVEPADADVVTLIDTVLDQYSNHPCVIGVGIDGEWYQWHDYNDPYDAGKPFTDSEAEEWLAEVQSYNQDYRFFLKHWMSSHMPPSQHDGITLISDVAQFGTEGENTPQEAYDNMMSNFGAWGDEFSDSEVSFQMGYPWDEWWWQDWMPDPIYDFGNDIMSWQTNCHGLYWVDFSIMDAYPPDDYR